MAMSDAYSSRIRWHSYCFHRPFRRFRTPEIGRNALGWTVRRLDHNGRLLEPFKRQRVAAYCEPDIGKLISPTLGLRLLDPADDWLCRLPAEYVRRTLSYHSTYGAVVRGEWPAFAKPLAYAAKLFPAAIYNSREEIPTHSQLTGACRILLSEPVTWAVEYRCFVLDRTVATLCPYFRYGRLNGRMGSPWPAPATEVAEAVSSPPATLGRRPCPATKRRGGRHRTNSGARVGYR